MRITIKLVLLCALVFFSNNTALAVNAVSIAASPQNVIQGEPFLVAISGLDKSIQVKKILFDNLPAGVFTYQNKPAALIGIDINKKPGTYKISASLSDGRLLETEIIVGLRTKIEAPLGIPQKLGGNTQASQNSLVTTLDAENKTLINLRTGMKAFWTNKFQMPLKEITVTDEYGYSRKTGTYSIAHKGTDFRAKEGTRINAINRGVVRVAKEYRNYGKTIVVDHGLGLMSFYMHLSKIKVNVGELVIPGQVIGLSGQTGYATQPHLHFTLRINDISIDPVKFFGLFNAL